MQNEAKALAAVDKDIEERERLYQMQMRAKALTQSNTILYAPKTVSVTEAQRSIKQHLKSEEHLRKQCEPVSVIDKTRAIAKDVNKIKLHAEYALRNKLSKSDNKDIEHIDVVIQNRETQISTSQKKIQRVQDEMEQLDRKARERLEVLTMEYEAACKALRSRTTLAKEKLESEVESSMTFIATIRSAVRELESKKESYLSKITNKETILTQTDFTRLHEVKDSLLEEITRLERWLKYHEHMDDSLLDAIDTKYNRSYFKLDEDDKNMFTRLIDSYDYLEVYRKTKEEIQKQIKEINTLLNIEEVVD